MADPGPYYMRRSTIWVDYAGRQRETYLVGRIGVGVPLTFASVASLSNASYDHYFEGDVTPVPGVSPLTSTPYLTSAYVLGFQLIDEPGSHHRIFLPAPLTADAGSRHTVLAADGINLNPALSTSLNLETTMSEELRNPFTGENIRGISGGWVILPGGVASEDLRVTTATAIVRREVRWFDAAGRGFRTLLSSRAGAPNTMAGLADITAAVVREWWEGTSVRDPSPPASSASYPAISDEAVLFFNDVSGSICTITVPAPKRSMFLADGKTVDSSNADVANLIASALEEILNPSNNLPFLQYISGLYQHSNLYSR